jgi:hypothetical protein
MVVTDYGDYPFADCVFDWTLDSFAGSASRGSNVPGILHPGATLLPFYTRKHTRITFEEHQYACCFSWPSRSERKRSRFVVGSSTRNVDLTMEVTTQILSHNCSSFDVNQPGILTRHSDSAYSDMGAVRRRIRRFDLIWFDLIFSSYLPRKGYELSIINKNSSQSQSSVLVI